MPIPYTPHSTSFHRYSSWGWDDSWAYTPSYFRPYHVEYAAPRESVHAGQPHVDIDHFKPKDRSRVQNKKKVVKQIYVVKRDGRKNASSDLNKIDKKLIDVLRTSTIDGKGKKKLSFDPPSVKSEQNKLKGLKIKKKVLLSKTKVQPRCLLGSSNWQKNELQKLSAQELKERNMAWVPKWSIQTQDKDDGQAKGAMQLKKKRRYNRRSPNLRFASNHQNYWSLHHPLAMQMPHIPMPWNSSLYAFGYPSYSYFDPRMPYGSSYHRGLSHNCYAY
ncbi:hypothetical protein PVAP13_3NG063000 [Panicum virgatum]|uniref:Uncharacterized protein n=1 Tax=Panicum virgatum TaxID=38727 RepID=A0A8T0TX14_PANVG|nr:hypothetical protein PVAP13_3NG063000 [Panicum virgatum]